MLIFHCDAVPVLEINANVEGVVFLGYEKEAGVQGGRGWSDNAIGKGVMFHGLSFQVEEVIRSAEWQGSPREQVYITVVWAVRWEGEEPVLAKDLSQDMVLREPERSSEPKDE